VKRIAAAALAVLALSMQNAAADTLTFYVNDSQRRDMVKFTSKAPLETVVGATGEVKGFVSVNAKDITDSPQAIFEVDLASLKTGIGLRDRHMREQYLETDKFPAVVFELLEITDTDAKELKENADIKLTARGHFKLHGVTKEITVPITVGYYRESNDDGARFAGELIRITAEFDVLLSDYEIKRPQFVILKLDDRQKVNIELLGSTELPEVVFGNK
jgi:polyisoprenoid-binding protein YceI